MSEQAPTNPDHDPQRAADLAIDRQVAAMQLPYHGLRHYENEGQRQTDLAAAERANIARAAGELGLTSGEWHAMRSELGRSPSPRDIKR